MANDREVMESLNFASKLEQFLEPKLPRRRLNKNWISNPKIVYEDEQGLDDDIVEPNVNDKAEKKRQRDKDESSLSKKKQNSKVNGDKVKAKRPNKDYEIEELFRSMRKRSKVEKKADEIAMQVEIVMANLEIAAEDDVELNKRGKPAISKLMKLPLLNESLSKILLQDTFLDHGVLNLLKNWLEPLPDGSLPNINIRASVLKILKDLRIDLDQDYRREQLNKSGLWKVLMFLSKSEEETAPNKRLANELVNNWSRIIYKKSTRYEKMYSQEEQEENEQILLKRQNKAVPPKVSATKARHFNVELDFFEKRLCKLAASREVRRARVPQAMSMDFTIHPLMVRVDKKLKALAKSQMDDSSVHKRIIDTLKRRKALGRPGQQPIKISATRPHGHILVSSSIFPF